MYLSNQTSHSPKARLWAKNTALPAIAGFFAIYLVALITRQITPFPQSPLLACSMGASAVILFMTPNSQFANPWAFTGGHIFSALVGISCAISISDPALSAAAAVGGAMLVMQLLHCMNPPGAATALAPIIAPHNLDIFSYCTFLVPLMINVSVMLLFSLLISRLIRFVR